MKGTVTCGGIINLMQQNRLEKNFRFRDVLFEYHRIVDRPARSRLLTGIPMLAVFQNLRWHSNKTSLHI